MRMACFATAMVLLPALAARAQSPVTVPALPSAPASNINLSPQEPASGPASSGLPIGLTRVQAEQAALKNNPRVTVSRLLALAEHQVVREARSAELPTANGAITAEKALEASRISAGTLTASRLFTHAGAGGNFTQLITDFGRTHNLVLTRKLEEKAANASALATREEIVLAADQAFYDALTAQAVLQVARQTVVARQATQTQVNQMTQNKLKSTLDLSFANVNLSQSQLVQLDAQNNADATMAALDAVLGLDHEVTYQLIDDSTQNGTPPPAFEPLIQTALAQRPDFNRSASANNPRRSLPARNGTSAFALNHGGGDGRHGSHPGGSVLHQQLVGRDRGQYEYPHLQWFPL